MQNYSKIYLIKILDIKFFFVIISFVNLNKLKFSNEVNFGLDYFSKCRISGNISNFKILIILILFFTKRDLLFKKIEIKSWILFLEIGFL